MADFYAQIRAAGTPRQTKAEIVDYFRTEYTGRGQKGWKQQLVNALSLVTGMKPKNLEKRFDPQRLNNPEKRNAAQYQELGAMLPTKPPENGYHIEGKVWIKFSDGECEERDIDEDITGEDAKALADAAYEGALKGIINHYMEADDPFDKETETVASPGGCREPELTVSAIEDD